MMKIQDARPFLGTDNHSVAHGAAQRRKAPETVLSRAAEVFISKRGAKLQRDAAIPDDLLTPAELALAADEKEREDKQAKKAQAKEIEERIASDKTLSDEDKSILQKQADKLKKEGMTDEDKLAQLYKERGVWERRAENDTLAADERQAAFNMVQIYSGDISRLQFAMKGEEIHKMCLRTQAVQERADLEAAAQKEQEKVDDAINRPSGDEASALETLLRYEAQRKAAKDKAAASEAPASEGQSRKTST